MANKLVDWVLEYIEEWRDHRDTNYLSDWKEYERLWRGEWAAEDRLRDSERSRITSPALQQAIENHTAEIEEAIFGQGDHLFDIEDDMMDKEPQDVEYLKAYMKESFKKNKLRKAVGDVTLLASIYGTGIGEIVLKKTKELVPSTRPMPDVNARAIGVEEQEKINVTLKPISPQNFLIDPTATSIEDALGVAIEEFVSAHKVAENVKAGVYKDTDIEDDSTPDKDLEPSWLDQESFDDKIKLIRYYGLVPAALLDAKEGEVEDLFKEEKEVSELMEEYGDLVEAIIVIGNDDKLLKAERSPYMMKDRPVIAYQDDTVPNRFWGRGVAEKGYNMQKAIDAQLRSHLDSLALTTVPMMGMDATRLPRGSKFEIKPGKSVLTNGNPAEILMPFKFGQTDGGNIQTAQAFETMLLQATGTLDTQSTQTQPAGGELSITLSSILKKNKRTLVNFQDQFLIPFIEKAAWRFMQFDPENFPVKDWKFIPSSTLGMLAREVEQAQIINLLKTLGPDSPIVPILLQGVLANSSLPNRNALMAQVQESMKPNPEQEKIKQLQVQLQAGLVQSQINEFNSRAQKQAAEAQQTNVETQFIPDETKAKLAMALSNNLDAGAADDKEFERRAKIADLLLKEKSISLKEQDMAQNAEIVKLQMSKPQGTTNA
jgi:hypothetical protein